MLKPCQLGNYILLKLCTITFGKLSIINEKITTFRHNTIVNNSIVLHLSIIFIDILVKLRYDDSKKVNCRCLPPCDDVNYVIESDNNMDW